MKYTQGLYHNWLEDVTSTEVDIFVLFACGCHLCHLFYMAHGQRNLILVEYV